MNLHETIIKIAPLMAQNILLSNNKTLSATHACKVKKSFCVKKKRQDSDFEIQLFLSDAKNTYFHSRKENLV